jgi:hypothetical protein
MQCRSHIARVKELPCVACHQSPVEAHHIRQSGITGGAQKASDWFTIPLCPPCHRQLHADKPLWEMRYGRQIDHVCQTLDRLYR